jgi:hypothetical protein
VVSLQYRSALFEYENLFTSRNVSGFGMRNPSGAGMVRTWQAGRRWRHQ